MKLIKTDSTKILDKILIELDAIVKPQTKNEVHLRYTSNGFLFVDLKSDRRVQVTALSDNDGVQLECDIYPGTDYSNLVMNRMNEDKPELIAEYIWNWLNVDKGFLMTLTDDGHRIERNESGNVVRYRKMG